MSQESSWGVQFCTSYDLARKWLSFIQKLFSAFCHIWKPFYDTGVEDLTWRKYVILFDKMPEYNSNWLMQKQALKSVAPTYLWPHTSWLFFDPLTSNSDCLPTSHFNMQFWQKSSPADTLIAPLSPWLLWPPISPLKVYIQTHKRLKKELHLIW